MGPKSTILDFTTLFKITFCQPPLPTPFPFFNFHFYILKNLHEKKRLKLLLFGQSSWPMMHLIPTSAAHCSSKKKAASGLRFFSAGNCWLRQTMSLLTGAINSLCHYTVLQALHEAYQFQLWTNLKDNGYCPVLHSKPLTRLYFPPAFISEHTMDIIQTLG